MASSYHHHLNCSKAQMCFFKILHIISSIPPTKEEDSFQSNNNNKGVGIDLNLRFCSITEESGESESSASSIDQDNNNNNNNEGEEEAEGVGEKSVDTQNQSFEVENNVELKTASFKGRGNEDGGGDSNCLDLLIEAARVLSGKNESGSEEERELSGELRTRRVSQGTVKKRKERWMVVDLYGSDVVEEEREPVVRSKRGRNQTLPYRFRDSVLEPLKRHSNRHHRPSSIADAPKRRLHR